MTEKKRNSVKKKGNSYVQDLALGEGQAARIAAFDRAVIADMDKPITTRRKQ